MFRPRPSRHNLILSYRGRGSRSLANIFLHQISLRDSIHTALWADLDVLSRMRKQGRKKAQDEAEPEEDPGPMRGMRTVALLGATFGALRCPYRQL